MGREVNIDVQVLYNNIPPMNIHEPEDIFRMRNKYGIPRDAKGFGDRWYFEPG